jgi:hypothetical protein
MSGLSTAWLAAGNANMWSWAVLPCAVLIVSDVPYAR